MRCDATCGRSTATTLGLPIWYQPRCAYDTGHEGDHALVWVEPGSGWPGRVLTATWERTA